MTKSKTFWAVAALISLAVMALAGYFVYERVSLHYSGDKIEVHPVPPPAASQAEVGEEAGQPEQPALQPKPETAKAAVPTPAEPEKIKAVKIAFEYKDAKARSVLLAGSFTSWKDVKMTKKKDVWKTDIYILPGTYPYHFTVDGKKKLDAGKPKAPTGDSLVTVN